MKNNLFKKSMSVFLTALMLMTCWVFMPATHEHITAEAAGEATAATNLAAINGFSENSFNTSFTTVSGNFHGDNASTMASKGYFKNTLYSPHFPANNNNLTDADAGVYFGNLGGTADGARVWYPHTTLIWDGVTTPQIPILFDIDSNNNNRVGVKNVYISSGANGLSFKDSYWTAKSECAKDTNYYTHFTFDWIMSNNSGNYWISTSSGNDKESMCSSKGYWDIYGTYLQYTGGSFGSGNTYYKAIKPTWVCRTGSNYTGTTNKTIYVIDFVPYKNAMAKMKEYYNQIKNNPGMYSTASVAEFKDVANKLINVKVNDYIHSSKNDVTGWNTAVSSALSAYNSFTLQKREFEVTYDNIFSLADWKHSASSEKSGNVTVNLNDGKVIVKHPNASGEYVTTHSGSSSNANTRNTNHYAMPVVGGQEYTFKYTTDGANTEMFAFFYDKNGGCAHESSFGVYCFTVNSGTGQKTFKAPDSATQMEIRFDNNTPSSTANFWDIMIYPAAVKTELEVDNWTARPHRQLYAYGTSVGTLQTPVRPGYIFDGWKEDTDGDGIGDAAAPTGTITSSRVLYSTWKPGTMDVGYDNLFSLSKWANSDSSDASNTNRGSIAYDIDAGTITAITTKDGEVYSNYGTAANHYQMAVKPNTEYIFTADVDLEGTGKQGQMFVFFYNASGSGVTGAIYNGATQSNPHIGLYVTNEGKNSLTFTTPSDCTKIAIRVGATVVPTTAIYSNVGIFEKAAYDAYAKDYAKVREPFQVGETKNLMIPTRAGYVFDGWELENGDKITTVAGLTANTTVYAAWTKEHTVTYYYGDNTTVLATVKVKDGATVGALPTVTPTKETTAEYSYTFKNWKANDTAFTASTKVTSDLKVYPVFDNVPHTFVWAANPYKNATCDAPALVGKSCSGCGYSLGNVPYDGDNEIWLAKGHDYSNINNYIYIEGNNDQHEIKCARYNTCKTTKLVNHVWDDGISMGDATCVTPGTVKKKCYCGAEKFVDGEIDTDAHNYNYTTGTPNNDNQTHTVACTYNAAHTKSVACTDTDGNCKCDVCNQELIHVYDKKTKDYEASEADCYNDAKYYLTCQCGKQGTETWTDEGSKLKHNWTDTEEYLKSEADCETGTVYYKECSLCHASSMDITGETWTDNDATGHDYTGEIRNNNNGTHSYLCKNDCGTYGYDKVKDAATDCTYGEWNTTGETQHVKTCSACGYKLKEDHNFTAWATTDANKQADGQHSKTCEICNKVVTEDCTYTEESFAETCTADGYTVRECKFCDHEYRTADKGKTGHDYTGAVKSYNNGQHSFLCKNGCNTYGYAGTENARTTCTYKYDNNIAGEHQATCTVCDYTFAEDCSGGTATCTKQAECTKCNTAYGETAPHSYTGKVVQLDGDKHAYLCVFCSQEGLYGVGAVQGATENCSGGTATCIALAVCDKCNDTHGDYAAHVYNGEAVKLDGDVHAYRCSVCKNNALYGVDNEDNKTEACSGGKATCTDLAVCTVCNDTHGELDADAHKWGAWVNEEGTETHKRLCEYNNAHTETEDCFSPDIVVIAPDCETPGYTLNTCEICGHIWHTNPTEPLGHDWSAWVNNNNGTHTRTCQDETCKYGENGGAKVETADCTKANAVAVVTEPTCTEGGYTTYTCKDCGYVWTDDATAATGHSYEKQTKKTDSKYQRSTKDCVTDWTYWYCCDNCDVSAETEKDKYKNEADLYWVREAAAGHKFDAKTATEAYIASAATCTAKATYYYSCSVCGTSSKETAQEKTFEHGTALGHDWKQPAEDKLADYLATPSDCITDAKYYYVCSRTDCGISSKDYDGSTWVKENSKSGHNFDYEGGYTAGVAATCTEDGVVEHYTCSICKKHFNADKTKEIAADKLTIAALKHDYKEIAAKAATCEEDGYTKHKQCQREGCGYRNTDYEVIPAKGHEFKAANGYYCDTGYNYHAYKCSNCDAYGVDGVKYSVDATGLDPVIVGGIKCEFTGEYVNYEANGIHSHKLSCVCGNETSAVCADAEPVHVDPTCTEAGYYVHTCDVCSFVWNVASDAEEDKALGHQLKVVSNNNGTHSKVCENNCGYEERAEKCSTATPATNCGERDVCDICKTAFGEAKPHVFTNYVSNNDAKCGIDGTKTAVCDTCTGEDKATDTIDDIGSALDHVMTEFGYSIDGWKFAEGFSEDIAEPTCKAEGLAVSYCENCNYYITQFVPKNENHSFGEWANMGGSCATGITYRRTCEYCGEAETKTEYDVEHELVLQLSKAATCTEDSIELYRCKNCGYSEETHETKAKGHTFGEPVEDKAATCKNPGRAYKYCSVCGASEKVVIPQLVHAWDKNNDGIIDSGFTPDATDNSYIYVEATNATCSADGYEGYFKCLDCSYDQHLDARWLAISGNYKPATGHVDKDGDGKCDGKGCNKTFGDGSSSSGDCGCICHKTNWFSKIIYKILCFFWKLFGIGKACDCGTVHY